MNSSDRNPPPAWLLAELDQIDTGDRELRRTSREGFEQMVRRHAGSDREVAEGMAWYDQYIAHRDAAVSIALAGPGGTFQAPPVPSPSAPRRDEEPQRFPYTDQYDEPDVPGPRLHVPQPDFDVPDAPNRSTRLVRAPGVYLKGLLIGLALAGLAWFAVTGVLHWVFGVAWWGWWPSLLTVPVALIPFVVWMTTVHDDVRHWIKKGGPAPLRTRFM